MITAAQMHVFAPRCDAATLAPLLNAEASRCGIDTGMRLSHWIAQMSVECEAFTVFAENLNYSAEGLAATWPARFPNAAVAALYARNPEKIANRVYAGRMGNGPETSGDGWRFRGRGTMMRTGRAGYAQAAANTGLDLVGHPELLEQPGPAAKDAADYWRCRNINLPADANDIAAVTRAVNGGLIGLADRLTAFHRARAIWND
jgi:putative chitinase